MLKRVSGVIFNLAVYWTKDNGIILCGVKQIMSYSTKVIVNASGGEASPAIKARVDTEQYFGLADTLENCIPTHYGSVLGMPGTKHVKRVKDVSKLTRNIRFMFSVGDAYVLEFSEGYIRFFQNSGSVVEAAQTITGATQANPCVITITGHGYSNGDSVDIESVGGMTELNNKRYLVANVTANTFELTDEDGNDIDSTGYTAYTSGGTAEAVYEISSPYQEEDLRNIKYSQQGDIMYIACDGYEQRELRRYGSTNWTLSTPTYDSLSWPAFGSINTTTTTITPSSTTGSITLTASSSIFTADHVGGYFKLDIGSSLGYVKITAYSSGTSVTATVMSTLGGTAATSDWYEGAWSDEQGWPVDVKFYEQRLYYFKDLKLYGSEQGVYNNFDNGTDSDATEDTDPVIYELSSNQIDNILWAHSSKNLTLGTASGPFTVTSGSSTEPITPTNPPNIYHQNESGANSVSPVRIGQYIYYVERSGTKLAEFAYNLETDAYQSNDITYLSDHILGDGVVDMAVQQYPYNIIWCVLEDGTMATLTRQIANNVRGWARQVISGTDCEVESVCVIPNGKEDQVWITVKRTINSQTVRYQEYFTAHDFGDREDVFFLHSGLTYDGAATDTITGLDHLEGETVSVIADGAVHPDVVVSNGSVTLNYEAEKVHIGLSYTSTYKTLDIESGGSAGTSQGKVTSISRVTVRFLNSLGCKLGDGTTMDVIPFRSYGDNFDEPPPLFTGDKEVQFPSGHVKNKYIVIQQDQPLPMHVLGLFPVLVSNR